MPHAERSERRTSHTERSTLMGPVLLYDGTCGFCAESVQTVLRHDRRGTLRFAPIQGEFGSAVVSRHPELRSIDSMIWVENTSEAIERVFVRSTAALRVAAYLGGVWRVLLPGYLVPASIRDAVYDFVARHRHHIMGSRENCLIVTPELQSRFLP